MCEKEHNNNHKKLWFCWQIIYAENNDQNSYNYHKHLKILGQELMSVAWGRAVGH